MILRLYHVAIRKTLSDYLANVLWFTESRFNFFFLVFFSTLKLFLFQMGRNKWYWLLGAPLYNYHYEGFLSSWYESFESRTRIPREALTYTMTALIGAAYVFNVLWSDARLIWGCGISLAFGLPFPLFLYDICRLYKIFNNVNQFPIVLSFIYHYKISHWPNLYERWQNDMTWRWNLN